MITHDTVTTRVIVQGQQAVNELGKLDLEIQEVKNSIRKMQLEGKDTSSLEKQLDTMSTKYKGLQENIGAVNMSMRQLKQYQKTLNAEYSQTLPGTKRYRELQSELIKVDTIMDTHAIKARRTNSIWSGLKKQLFQFGVMALAFMGFQALIAGMQALIKYSMELSDAMSDVRKTTGLTDAAVNGLVSTFKYFNTRTPRMELLKLAEIAGRLGIRGTKDIEGFVKAADQINVSLGDVLGDAETVMKEMGKLTMTFGITDTYSIEEAMLKVGSSINELGMSSTANERNIVNFTKRLAGIAPIAKISIQDIMGIGATLDALGQTVEVSGTAISRLFIEMAQNAGTFAKFARMSVQDFTNLLNKDANEAFIRVLQGVQDNTTGLTELAEALGELEIDGTRVIGVFSNLANNTKLLRTQQLISNQAFAEGSSVTEEFTIKNENLAANVAKTWKAIKKFFMPSWLIEGLNSFFTMTARLSANHRDENAEMVLEMKKTTDALQVELLALSRANIPQEERVRLIRQINRQYEDYLPHLIDEEASLSDIADMAEKVNSHLMQKILYMEYQEEIARLLKQEIASNKGLLKIEMERHRLSQKAGRMHPTDYADELAKLDAAEKFNTMLLSTSKDIQEMTEYEYVVLAEKMGTSLQKIKDIFAAKPSTPITTENGNSKIIGEEDKELTKALEKWREFKEEIDKVDRDYKNSRLEKDEQELIKIIEKYEKLEDTEREHVEKIKESRRLDREEYKEHRNRLQEIEVLKDTELADKKREFKERDQLLKEEAFKRIDLETMSEQEREIANVISHYDELIQLAQKYGWDTTAIIEMQEASIAAIRSKFREEDLQEQIEISQAKMTAIQSFGDVFSSMVDLMGTKQGEMNAAQKVMALFQIGADLAVSLMKAQVVALSAAATSGPAAPYVYAATKASMVASILQGAARAKSILFGASSGSGGNASAGSSTVSSNPFSVPRSRREESGAYTNNTHKAIPTYSNATQYTPNVSTSDPKSSRNVIQKGLDPYNLQNQNQSDKNSQLIKLIVRELSERPQKAYIVLDEYEDKKSMLDLIKKDAAA